MHTTTAFILLGPVWWVINQLQQGEYRINYDTVDKSFNMAKKFAIIVVMALVHFGLSILVVALAMSIATGLGPVQPELSPILRALVVATRILHFPIISLSLYSRHWFPGNLIYLPILINSFLWGTGIYLLFLLAKKRKEKHKNGKGNH